GPAVRRRLDHWTPPAEHSLSGRVIAITGATSGIGREAARQCAAAGAELVLLNRNARRAEAVAAALRNAGAAAVTPVECDLADLESVGRAARTLEALPALHGLIHNGGAMAQRLELTPQGLETTAAVHVVAPFVLTTLCARRLRDASARIIVVTSGGMYAVPLDVEALRRPREPFDGVRAYALAKRAQVSLVEQCGPALRECGVPLVAMHPGWVDTPGLRTSLPRFRRIMAPLLRSPAEGAAAIAWLLTAPADTLGRGALWLDRRPRSAHRSARTRRSDTPQARAQLVRFCRYASGLTPAQLRVWN
ncbi:MAG TPA: SDR family NAD(P)-dependent oxidoreductase, partial [Candidatus Dormibacteraeota bacterium]